MGMCNEKNREQIYDDKMQQKDMVSSMAKQPFQREVSMQIVGQEEFTPLKVLGRGGYGKVLLVEHKVTLKKYAMKTIDKEKIVIFNQKKYIFNERNILAQVSHPFIVKLHFAFQNQSKLYLILDFVIGGELSFHLKSGKLSEEHTKFYAAEMILALEHLHSLGIIYRDLKPENILIETDGHLKLTDFGLSKTNCQENQRASTFCGTYEYMAPEIFKKDSYSKSVDWYSLGSLMYFLASGMPPCYNANKKEMFKQRSKEQIPMKEHFSAEFQDLLCKLLIPNPKKRLGFHGAREVKDHPFFTNVNWEDVYLKKVTPPIIPQIENDSDIKYFEQRYVSQGVEETPAQYSSLSNSELDFKKFTFIKDEPIDQFQQEQQ